MKLNFDKSMANRAKKLSVRDKKLKACRKRELLKDRISELPDEIIVYVLSLLTMKEAGRTSVLSKRWRYVWAYIPILNFDASNTLNKLLVGKLGSKLLEVEKPRYLSWVNQTVGSHKGPTIDEFRVGFDLGAASSYSIDNWVQFVMEKRVKRLQLDFSPYIGGKQNSCYTFRGLSSCNSLTSLQLVSVNVTGEVLQSFFKSCPNLEYLSVKDSESLVNLEVDKETPNLKYLEICLCFEIKHIQICAPNLVSFEYFGPEINMPFERTPKLAKLSIGGEFGEYLTNNFSEFSSYLCQLEALTLTLALGIKYAMKSVDQFPLCIRLVHLELKVHPLSDEDLFCFAKIIKACPFLHKFVLKLDWSVCRIRRKRLDVEACPHYHLKVVEVVGFLGNEIDLEFIMYLMESCVALEKIVVNPCNPFHVGTPFEFNAKKRKKRARKQAQQLRAKLNLGADLIIL